MPTLAISTVTGFTPLDAQFGRDDKLFFPAALERWLNGPDNLFVLLDGAKIVNLPEMLETSGLPHLCLFDEDQTEIASAGPWLVALSPHHRLTRALFTAEGAPHLALWPEAAALFLRASLPLAELRKHFRRFMRVEDGGGQMYFFRFWEPTTCVAYFRSVGDSDDLISRWFCPRDGGQITGFLVPDITGNAVHLIEPRDLPEAPYTPKGAFKLRDVDHAAMAQSRLEHDLKTMVALLAATFPERMDTADPAETDLLARRTVSRMHSYGFTQKDHLFTLLAWELHYGPMFENRDPDGHLRKICEASLPESEKFALLSDRVAKFE